MGIHLSINVISGTKEQNLQTTIGEITDCINNNMERELIKKFAQIVSIVKYEGGSIQLKIDLDVKDANKVLFLINKRFSSTKEELSKQFQLSLREIEILELIKHGHTNVEIAKQLFISLETVRTHRRHILNKMGAHNTASLMNVYHNAISSFEVVDI
jgi:DNA-binding CsgD family transcriptional regulator